MLAYAAILASFVALDAVWLAFAAIDMFKQHVGSILRERPDVLAAISFYCIYPAGLYALAARPAYAAGSYRIAICNGAIAGLTAYATFDLTNLAIMKGWTPALALLDMAWGTAASAVAASVGYAVARRPAIGRQTRDGQRRT